MDFLSNVPVLTIVKLDPSVTLNQTHPLPGYNFEELFIVIGEFPGVYEEGNAHYLLYRWRANGSNKVGMMPGQISMDRFMPIDPDHDL